MKLVVFAPAAKVSDDIWMMALAENLNLNDQIVERLIFFQLDDLDSNNLPCWREASLQTYGKKKRKKVRRTDKGKIVISVVGDEPYRRRRRHLQQSSHPAC